MKISSYLLGMGAVASLVALNITPANAQLGNGSDNGNIFTSITNVGGGGIVGSGEATYASQSQSAVNQFSQSLTANSVGDAATFDTINGGAPGPLVAALLPAGVPADGATGKAATNLANTVQGLRAGNGDISATKLNASVGAYNDYIKAYVGEVGPEKALTDAPNGQKALQGVLGQLIQIANQSAPTAAPATPPSEPAPPSTPVPQVPTTPPAPSAPVAPPTPK
ncbi:hypothetical protein [Chamaesiphon polymorphus]|uniref:Uncharacterized protein n=1 Tax=Chamaesiphon polymorphus CCALA 037 TaxID=2107692 RepID=A0A2T1GFH9_9CYAN|nr:hypothetical protein [Chamaesiphon polymorphus]PSB56305.1 hypothetical protein C7B77_12320 [Chamaesiphon polymorphus CCALA 037]